VQASVSRHSTLVLLLISTIAAVPGLTQTAPPMPHTPDMLGIYPGMPARAARATLQKHSAQYQVQDNAIPETGFSLTIPDPQHRDTTAVDLTQAPNDPAVWMINRGQTFGGQNQMSTKALLTALREKYGKETMSQDRGGGGLYFYWLFDPSGRLLTSADQALTGCNGGALSVLMRNHSPIPSVGPEQPCYKSFFGVVANFNRAANPELLQAYNVQLVNMPYAYRAAINTLNVNNREAEKQHQQEMKKANENKPVF
jgi:hypothetical protein